ncbi:MAG: TlpA disulfide reductase family protein [Solirubrobacteraceae bacterium]|nr:TlpA disulfide reductase family protein [Solirubrobacteraceae bacterium]
MRPATDTIHAPPFPRSLPWINTEALRIDKQLGRPLVVAFWDARRAVSLRPLMELERWHRDYAPRGARVIAVHVDGDASGIDEDGVRAAAARLDLTMPIVLDTDLLIADGYGLRGVPSRYIFDQGLRLADAHFGLGGLADGEALLRALVEHGERSLEARRAEGEAAATVQAAVPASEPEVDEGCDQGAAVPAAKQPRLLVHAPAREELPEPLGDPAPYVAPEPGELLPGNFRGDYAAGGVWLQLRGTGTVAVDGRAEPLEVDGDGTYLALESGLHTPGVLRLEPSDGVVCEAIQLEPGVSAID